MSNPLLHEMLARDDLPRYDLIQPAQVAAAMDTLIAEARATLARVTAPANAISWATVIEPSPTPLSGLAAPGVRSITCRVSWTPRMAGSDQ